MSTIVTQTDVERRAGGDGNEYTYAEFLNYHNGDRKAAQADWDNSAAGLAGELSTGFGGMDLDDQEDQQQQQLLQVRAEQAKKKAAQEAAQEAATQQGAPTHFNNRAITIRGGYVYYSDELNNDPQCDPIGEFKNNQVDTSGYAGAQAAMLG